MEKIKKEKIRDLNKKTESTHLILLKNKDNNDKFDIYYKLYGFFIFIFKIIFELMIICINYLGFYFYYKSLNGCKGTQIECLEVLKPKFFYQLGYFCLYSSIITSVIIFLCIIRFIHLYHIFYLIIGYLSFFSHDHGSTFEKHGQYNLSIFLILVFLIILFLCIINIVIKILLKKYYKTFIFSFSFLLIIFYILRDKIIEKSNCSDWIIGLNNTKIDNNNTLYKCELISPIKCRINFYDNVFDLSPLIGNSCDKLTNRYKEREILINMLNNSKFKKTRIFGFPITIKMSLHKQKNLFQFNKKVLSQIYDMEKTKRFKKNEKPEITLHFSKDDIGTIKMNLHKNKYLIKSRKKKEKSNYFKSKFNQIIFIYIDSISRVHFLRKMPKVSNFIETFMKYNKTTKYRSYQFIKYHNFAPFTQINVQPMFYGKKMSSKSGRDILFYLKNNGFITGQSSNLCSKEVFAVESHYNILYVNFSNFDHENIAMFCDPNYYDRNNPYPLHKGPFSIIRKCLYGKDTFEYVLEYGKKFWELYPENKKYLRLSFIDAHEGTGEVIKYLDQPLYNFLFDFYINDYLKNTALFIVSDHGNNMPGFYNVIQFEDFEIEKTLGVFYLILYDFKKDEFLIENQQILITPYDIHDTLINIIYGEGNSYGYSLKGRSVLYKINGYNRTCSDYPEIKDEFCRCKKT
jgi:hypothetical protein